MSKGLEALRSLPRGLLIAFEGLDRSGKSTQLKMLSERLAKEGLPCKTIDYPDRSSETGLIIDKFLTKQLTLNAQVIHLLFSANRWEKNEEIKRALAEEKRVIIVDRYAYSGVAYSAAKGIRSAEELKNPDRGLIRPDLVFYMDIDPEVSKNRGDFGKEIYEKVEFQKLVGVQFKSLTEDNWNLIDARKAKDDIEIEVWSKLEKFCENNPKLGEPRELWPYTNR